MMTTPPASDQVKIEYLDERVRCGPALFTPFQSELEVRFLNNGPEASIVKYDLNSVPLNQACLLHDGRGHPTNYLICNQWGTLHVRYGPIPPGRRYPALLPRKVERHIRLSDDLIHAPNLSSSAFHPNPNIPLLVRVSQDQVRIELMQGGLTSQRWELKLSKVPAGRWYTPTDDHRQPLPVRLRRPLLAGFFNVRVLDLEWVG
jgi:hypothetical protein